MLEELAQFYTLAHQSDESSEKYTLPLYTSVTLSEHYGDPELVASGGMKDVFKVFDNHSNRYIAMAKLHREASRELYDAFISEAQLTAALQHPNIISVHEVGVQEDGTPFFTMELKTGQSLAAMLKDEYLMIDGGGDLQRSSVCVNDLLEIFLKVCDAIAYAHSRGVLHLDLKPDNIQIGLHGEVIVCDWGLAKVATQATHDPGCDDELDPDVVNTVTLGGSVKGTPGYMAPEQISGDEKTILTDVYGLGALLYSLVVGRSPVIGVSTQEMLDNTISGTITPPHQRGRGVTNASEALSAIAMKALATEPGERYASVSDLKRDVRSYMTGYSTSAENAGLIRELKLFYQRQRVVCNLTLLFGVLVAIAITVSVVSIKKSERLALQSEKQALDARDLLEKEKKERLKLSRHGALRYLVSARRYHVKGQMALAREKISNASVLAPDQSEIRYEFAVLLFAMKKYDEAAAQFPAPQTELQRRLQELNELYRDKTLSQQIEFDNVRELLRHCQYLMTDRIVTTLMLHWLDDPRSEFRKCARGVLNATNKNCHRLILFAQRSTISEVKQTIVGKVLKLLENPANANWRGRRRPLEDLLELTTDPELHRRIKVLLPANLALWQSAESTGAIYRHAYNAVNGIIGRNNFWSASPNPVGLTVDLGNEHLVSSFKIYFTNRREGEFYHYTIEVSVDGSEFETVVDRSSDATKVTEQAIEHTISETSARYVRLNILSNSHYNNCEVSEFEVY